MIQKFDLNSVELVNKYIDIGLNRLKLHLKSSESSSIESAN